MNNKPLLVAIIIAVVLAIGGVVYSMTQGNGDHSAHMNDSSSSQNESPNTASEAPTGQNAVVITDYKFNPSPITVKKGTTVTWTNDDTAKHNVAFDEKPAVGEQEGPLLGKGETYSFTFTETGTFGYYCSPHPYMKASVTVVE